MKEVRFHPRVPGEVRKIISYYEEIAPKLAEDFWLELNEAIRSAQVDRFSKVFAPIGLNFEVGESSSLRSKNGGKRPKARPSALFDQSWSPLHSFLTPWMASF